MNRNALAIVAVLALLLVAAAFLRPAASSAHRVDGERGRALVGAGATLLDVRTPEEFAEGHIEGARNVPVQVLTERLTEVPRDEPVVVYCRSGSRSAAAAQILERAGYTVYDAGAMSAW